MSLVCVTPAEVEGAVDDLCVAIRLAGSKYMLDDTGSQEKSKVAGRIIKVSGAINEQETAVSEADSRKVETRHRTDQFTEMTGPIELREEALRRRHSIKQELKDMRKRLNNTEFVLEPTSKLVQKWDAITFIALIFTAIMAPVEAAFFNEHQDTLDARFFLNRVIDLVFYFDIYMQFVVCYHSKANNLLIKSRRLIAKRYLAGWFVPDVLSCIPIDILAFLLTSQKQRKLLRMLRMLRLFKLIRVARAKRIVGRWRQKIVMSFSQAQISMVMLIMELCFFSHWIACLWGFSAHESLAGRESRTWLVAYSDSMTDVDGRKQFHKGSTADKYVASRAAPYDSYREKKETNGVKPPLLPRVLEKSARAFSAREFEEESAPGLKKSRMSGGGIFVCVCVGGNTRKTSRPRLCVRRPHCTLRSTP